MAPKKGSLFLLGLKEFKREPSLRKLPSFQSTRLFIIIILTGWFEQESKGGEPSLTFACFGLPKPHPFGSQAADVLPGQGEGVSREEVLHGEPHLETTSQSMAALVFGCTTKTFSRKGPPSSLVFAGE